MPTPYDKSSAQPQYHPAQSQQHPLAIPPVKNLSKEGEAPPSKTVSKEGEAPTQQAAIAPGQSIPTSTTLAALVPLIFTNKSAALVDGNLRVTALDAQSFILDWGTAQQPTAAYMYVQARPVAPNTIFTQ